MIDIKGDPVFLPVQYELGTCGYIVAHDEKFEKKEIVKINKFKKSTGINILVSQESQLRTS